MPESCHLPRYNLTFANDVQNVWIGYSESETKEIHCSCRQCSETPVLCVATSHLVIPMLPFITFWRTHIKEQNSFLCFGIIEGQICAKSVDPAFNLGCGHLIRLNKMSRVQAHHCWWGALTHNWESFDEVCQNGCGGCLWIQSNIYMLVWRVGLKQLFMKVYLYNKDTEGILLVNAANVFNDMNRKSSPTQHELYCPNDNPI